MAINYLNFHCFILLLCALLSVGCGGSKPPQPEQSEQLNDTGVTLCKNQNWSDLDCAQAPSQDGAVGRDIDETLIKIGSGTAGFDFTRIDASGLPASTDSTQWACVQDNVTQLVWEVKSANVADVNAAANTYTWYQPDSTINGGNAGLENGGVCNKIACDTNAYIAWVNSQSLCGFNKWRLPSVTELLSIVDQSITNPPLDRDFFPNSAFNAYWSYQTVADSPENAWYVYFTAASNGNIAKTGVAHIRLVSEGK